MLQYLEPRIGFEQVFGLSNSHGTQTVLILYRARKWVGWGNLGGGDIRRVAEIPVLMDQIAAMGKISFMTEIPYI